MSQRELYTWELFSHHEPLPDRMFDIHLSRLAAMIMNIGTVRDTPVEAADYFLIKSRPSPVPSGEREIDRLRRQWRGE